MSSTGNPPAGDDRSAGPKQARSRQPTTPEDRHPTTRTRPPGPPAAPRQLQEPSATTIPALDTAPLLRDEVVPVVVGFEVAVPRLRPLGSDRRRRPGRPCPA